MAAIFILKIFPKITPLSLSVAQWQLFYHHLSRTIEDSIFQSFNILLANPVCQADQKQPI